MLYTSFYISNFRGIKEVSIDLANNRVITLVGLNESGKSTILEAINYFYKIIHGGTLDQSDYNSFRPKGINFTGEIEISGSLLFEKEDIQKIEEYNKSKSNPKELIFPTSFKYTYKFVYDLHKYIETKFTTDFNIKVKEDGSKLFESDREYWNELLNYVEKNLIPEILFYEDFIFNIPNKISFAKSGDLPPEIDPNLNNPWQLVLNDILKAVDQRLTSFQEHIVNIWDSDNDTAANRISQMERILNRKITSGWKQLFKEGTGRNRQRLNFKEIKLSPSADGNILNISFVVKSDSGKEFVINERSKGFKWFFSFLLFTEFRKRRTKNILFLLDEPASNLHSSAQKRILEAIKELGNGSMVIYSTHSHHLINTELLSGVYVIINEDISKEKLEGDLTFDLGAKISAEKYFSYIGKGLGKVKISYFQPILDSLNYAPSNVEPIPNITITEGKNDWYTFKFFQSILQNRYEFNFYPGAGCSQHWDIIRLYLSWGKKFILILDGDSAGKSAKADYTKEFNKFVEDRIFTLEDIFGKELETEDLIEEKDKELICDAAFGKGKYATVCNNPNQLKLTLNTAIMQLLINKKKITPSAKTLNNFKKIFSFIKKSS